MITPARLFLQQRARERFARAAGACARLSAPELRLAAAYSVKTNPRAELLDEAFRGGFFAEVIAPDELQWAFDRGFGPERIVYNGPEALRERPRRGALAVAFADSLEAAARYASLGVAGTTGVRLRPARVPSRFGVPADDDSALGAVLRTLPPSASFGVSFHVRREDLGGLSWRDAAAGVLERTRELESAAGRRASVFDMGGGWEPDALDAALASDFPWLIAQVRRVLPAARTLLFEPGQSLATPCEELVTTVLEVRRRAGRIEAIVDAGYPDVPQLRSYEHPVFVERDGRRVRLGPGGDRVGGRTCLEYDIVARDVTLPADLAEGERLVVGDCGSYDSSMAFRFARGGEREAFAYPEGA